MDAVERLELLVEYVDTATERPRDVYDVHHCQHYRNLVTTCANFHLNSTTSFRDYSTNCVIRLRA
jgi:hypothetical protein